MNKKTILVVLGTSAALLWWWWWRNKQIAKMKVATTVTQTAFGLPGIL